MVLSRLTKITGPGIRTDTNWVGNNANYTGILTAFSLGGIGNITATGIITASSFSGDGSGLIGVASTDNIITGTAATFNTYPVDINAGMSVAGVATFAGNVSIAGTLTYEDVTNIDSVGIITGKGADINGDLDVDGHTNLDNVSVAGVTTFTGTVNVSTINSTASNLAIHNTADRVLIKGSNRIDLADDQVRFQNRAQNAALLDATSSYVKLYQSGNEKLATTSQGIIVGTGVTIETNGQATFVGIVTFGSSSTTINGNTDTVNVGTALTIGHSQGLQYHTQNLHAQGFEVNQINASGIITATSYRGDGSQLTGIVAGLSTISGVVNVANDLDVDGHTNLDNVSIAGVTTFSGILDATNTPASIRVAQDIQHKGDADTKITFPAADQISFETGGSNRLKIHNYDSNHNVEVDASAHLSLANNGSNGRFIYIGDANASSTGYMHLQPGGGSQGFGGGIRLYSHSNSTNAGGVYIGKSHASSGAIIFGNGGMSPLNEYARIDSSGRVQIGGVTGPNNAKLFVAGTNSTNYVTIRNTSAADSSGSRWGSVRFQGTQSGGEVSDLVHLQANHEGSSDDQKGAFQIQINDGNDGDSLQERMHLYSTNSTSQPIVKFISSNSGDMLNLQNSSGGGQGMIFGVDTSGSNNTTYLKNNTSAFFDFTFYMGQVSSTYERIRIKQDEFRNSTQFFSNKTTIASNKTITTSYNHMTIGNITINSGVTVTVNSGARWVIV